MHAPALRYEGICRRWGACSAGALTIAYVTMQRWSWVPVTRLITNRCLCWSVVAATPSATDALYVELAETAGLVLLTTDGGTRLALSSTRQQVQRSLEKGGRAALLSVTLTSRPHCRATLCRFGDELRAAP